MEAQDINLNELVSIITPLFNSEKHLEETIQSVQKQTHTNWEWNIVDDCSTDGSIKLIERFAEKDNRIHVWKNSKNSGAAFSRNVALEKSKGRFIAYIDSDDLWDPDKLSRQLQFMQINRLGFTCASYRVISEDGTDLKKVVRMRKQSNYKDFLMNNLLQTVGIMVDLKFVPKAVCVMPDIRRRQDAATWLQILKSGNDCFGMQAPLASYRRTAGSLSSNKFKAISGVWNLYRNIESLSLPFSIYCFARYAMLAVWKRMYPEKNS